MAGEIPRRKFGSTGEEVSILGVGGAHIGFADDEKVGIRIIHQAIDAGATFLDNAWEYNDGDSERRMGKALAEQGSRDKVFLMTKDCAHDRMARHSMLKLDQSLKRLQTDHLDLWQLHEVVWESDPRRIFSPGGSAESLLQAKEEGKVRYIGFTGHKHPEIMKEMLSHDFPFDACMMPINVFDAHYASFVNEILPLLNEKGIACIGMKSFASGDVFKGTDITPQEALSYAMSQEIATLVSGMDTIEVLEQNLEVARDFKPLTAAEQDAILARSKPAATGEFERFKTTRDFDANEGRVANYHPLMAGPAG